MHIILHCKLRLLSLCFFMTFITACGNRPVAVLRLSDDSENEVIAAKAQSDNAAPAADIDSNIPPVPTTIPTDKTPIAPDATPIASDPTPIAQNPVEPSKTQENDILKIYAHLDPSHIVPSKHLNAAIVYFHTHQAKIKNQNIISVIDYSVRSTQKRFWVIDIKTGSVWAIRKAHGKGSDTGGNGYATAFSNTAGSNATSLGFFLAAETYEGSHGLSLHLDGLSTTNSNARNRAIVIHGADYVSENEVIQGRSWGCPAIAMENRNKLINLLQGGSLIYAGYK